MALMLIFSVIHLWAINYGRTLTVLNFKLCAEDF